MSRGTCPCSDQIKVGMEFLMDRDESALSLLIGMRRAKVHTDSYQRQ